MRELKYSIQSWYVMVPLGAEIFTEQILVYLIFAIFAKNCKNSFHKTYKMLNKKTQISLNYL